MLTPLFIRKAWAGIGLFFIQVSCVLALGLEDPLNTPAQQMSNTASIEKSLLLDVQRLPGSTRVMAVGARGHIIYSDDGAKTWLQAKVPVQTTLTALYFVTSQIGWAVGHDGVILKSEDGGKNWIKQFDGFHQSVVASIESMRVDLEKTENTLAQAEDAALYDINPEAFETLENRFYAKKDAYANAKSAQKTPLMDVWFKNVSEGFAVGAYGRLYHTHDGGKYWRDRSQDLNNSQGAHLNAIVGLSDDKIFIAGEAGMLFRSLDGGSAWGSVYVPYEGSLYNLLAIGHQQILVFGLRGNIFSSDNLGLTWRSISHDARALLTAGYYHSRDKIAMIVGNNGTVLSSNDNGQSFSAHIREDRASFLAVAPLAQSQFVAVGAQGVKVINFQGLSANPQ